MIDQLDKELSAAIGQRNDAWSDERLGMITSSKSSIWMSEGRAKDDKYSVQCINYLYSRIAEILIGSAHMAGVGAAAISWGEDFEEEAFNLYKAKMKLKKVAVRKTGFMKFNDYAGGSPDGTVGTKGILEIKCPYDPTNHIKTLVTGLPYDDKFRAQIQCNILFTGSQFCDFVTYDPRIQDPKLKMTINRIKPDTAYHNKIIERLKDLIGIIIGFKKKFKL